MSMKRPATRGTPRQNVPAERRTLSLNLSFGVWGLDHLESSPLSRRTSGVVRLVTKRPDA